MKPVMVHYLKRNIRNRQQGSAALITTIAISAILVVLFVGITTIATREIRQSINADNSSRALYAAEAGVEDAARRLANDPNYVEPTCNSKTSGNEVQVSPQSANSDTAWTCRTVTHTSANIEGRLDKDQAVQLDLSKAEACDVNSVCSPVRVEYMTIQWNNPAVDSAVPLGAAQDKPSSFLPYYIDATHNDWGSRAAALELTATWYHNPTILTGPLKGNDLASGSLGVFPVRTALATPVSGASDCSGSPVMTCNTTDPQPATAPQQSGITSKCNSDNKATYNCDLPANMGSGTPNADHTYKISELLKADVHPGIATTPGNPLSDNVILRIKPRYAAASYLIKFYTVTSAPGDPITIGPAQLADGYATIDVTARSGNYFRRVRAKKQIAPTVFDGIFDGALFSGKDICKDMTVYNNNAPAPDSDVARRGRNSCDPS